MPGLQWSIAREPGSDSRRQFIRAPGAPVSRTRTRIVRYCNYSRVAADGRQRLDHYTGEVDQCDSSAAGKRTGNVSHRCETVARSIQVSGLAFFPGTRRRLADRVRASWSDAPGRVSQVRARPLGANLGTLRRQPACHAANVQAAPSNQASATRRANLSRSMFPPDTIATIFPVPARPDRAAATAHAAAPSIITRFRSATSFIASAASLRVTTSEPSSSLRACSNIFGNTVLLPMPSTNDG